MDAYRTGRNTIRNEQDNRLGDLHRDRLREAPEERSDEEL